MWQNTLRTWIGRCMLLVGAAAIPAANFGCASDQAVIQQAGDFHTGLEKAVINDPQLDGYINAVGQRIIREAQAMARQGYRPKSEHEEDNAWMFSQGMKFHFVNSKTLNAFTTGGEHMYIYTALFQNCKSEDELAAVMAHEYGHVFGRHIHNGMNRQIAVLLGAGAAAAAGYAIGGSEHGGEYAGYGAALGMVAGGLANAGFSREDEAEADQLGFDFYIRCGWHPDRFGDFFRQMRELEKKRGGGGPEWLGTHPALEKRVAYADQRAAEWKTRRPNWQQLMQPPVASPAEFRRLQERAKQVGATMPDDTSLENAQELLQAIPRSCLNPDEPQDNGVKAAQFNLQQKANYYQQLGEQQRQR